MSTANDLAEIGALFGDPVRANMVTLLLDGSRHAASELAANAGVTRSTASWHLAKLQAGSLVDSVRSGRNRYFKLASPLTAQLIETALALATRERRRHRPATGADEIMKHARTCYDHLAGRLGVAVADALIEKRWILLSQDGGEVTGRGERGLTRFGLDLTAIKKEKRIYCRPCLDWTERRFHLAGAIGAALAQRCLDLGWVERRPGSRALELSKSGQAGFARRFGVRLGTSST
jgi:DNA-binding transcriptional ArsR family regulator